MKYFIYFMNILLVILIPIVFIVTPIEKKTSKVMSIDTAVRQLPSEVLNIEDEQLNCENDSTVDEDTDKDEEDIVEVSTKIISDVSEKRISSDTDNSSVEDTKKDVLETNVGKMSGYGPDCKGCSGYLASGKYVGDGSVYYDDSTYGKVRILAGDSIYKFGTIIRVNNSKAGSFLGIVLDRGGSIGFGKTYLFDLLYTSEREAMADEVSYNVVFEVLRYGY